MIIDGVTMNVKAVHGLCNEIEHMFSLTRIYYLLDYKNIKFFSIGQSFVLRSGYRVGEEKGIASCLLGGPY